MWSPNELLKTEKQRDILSYITLQFFPFKKVPLEHYPFGCVLLLSCLASQSRQSMTHACSRVAVSRGRKLPSGIPLITPARCSASTAGRA